MSFLLYKNPAKRTTQSKMLGRAIRNSVRGNNKKLRVLCLPGSTCWDVAYFSAFEEVAEITCLEEDAVVFSKIKQKIRGNKKALALNKTTTEFFMSAQNGSFDIIYLDYFASFHTMIKVDIKLIFKRRILATGGKLIVSFLGAREPGYGSIENKMFYLDFCELFKRQAPHIDNAEMIRCCAFNAHLFNIKNEYKIKLSRPSWRKYKTEKAYMYMVATGYNGDGRRDRTISKDLWFRTGSYAEIKETTVKSTVPTTGLRPFAQEERLEHYKKLILDFYELRGYSPHKKDIAKENIIGFTGIVRSVGLCPRKNSTREEVKEEVLRIYKKHNMLSWTLLNRAKIAGRLDHFGYAQTIRQCGLEVGRKGKIYLNKKRIIQFRILSNYIAHLDSGLHRTKFRHYSWIRHRSLTTRLAAKNRFNVERSWLESLPQKETVYRDVITLDLEEIFNASKGTLRFKPLACTVPVQ